MEKDQIVKGFYEKLLEKYGYSIKSLDYRSETSQKTRFDIITQVGINDDCSLLDVGCGFGDYFNYLKQRGIKNVKYNGIDLTDKIVNVAKEKNPLANVVQGNVLDLPDDKKFDYVVSVGVNGVKTGDNWDNLTSVLDKMWKLCKKGIAYNAVSNFASEQDEQIYFVSPIRVIEHVMNNLTYKVVFRHDYMPHDFTIYVYKLLCK
jgi:2-polyprenyl-3-methyl-5-hydroxy-6-metoxy-1,4-benzoquinol methylase